MNSIWNKNIQIFSNRFSSLYDLYKNLIFTISKNSYDENLKLFSFWNIQSAKNGSITVSENNLRLHSSYNPEKEAESVIQKQDFSNNQSIVFLGFGLGYHVCSCAKKLLENKAFDKKLILIECEPLYFFASLYFLDWTQVFNIEQLILAIGCPLESIIPLIENSQTINTSSSGVSSAYFFTIPAFTAHNQNYFDGVKELIERNKTKNDINAATYDKFAKLWIKNSLLNIKFISKCKPLWLEKKLFESNKCDKFLLLAAGPSLEKHLPKIKEIQDKIIIVCVETVLKALLNANINPDYILLTDPQYYAYKHISALKAPKSKLICPISVYPAVFRFECKEILLCSDMFPVSDYFEGKIGKFGDLGAGGSVASSAWNFCKEMGAKEIYIGGLDLSYPSKETHIRGSNAEQAFHQISNKLKTVEKSSINSMYHAFPEYGINYAGEKVLTDSKMKMFAWWFESRIAACSEIKNFTLCKESLKIPGISYIDNFYEMAKKFSFSKSLVIENQENNLIISSQKVESILDDYNKELSKLINLVNKAVEKCMINGPELKSELKEIESEIQKNQLNTILQLEKPSSKYFEQNPTNPQELALYQKLQKDLLLYKSEKY